jgi:hypothetical protein
MAARFSQITDPFARGGKSARWLARRCSAAALALSETTAWSRTSNSAGGGASPAMVAGAGAVGSQTRAGLLSPFSQGSSTPPNSATRFASRQP